MGTRTSEEYYIFISYLYGYYRVDTPNSSAHRYNYLANILLKLDLIP